MKNISVFVRVRNKLCRIWRPNAVQP